MELRSHFRGDTQGCEDEASYIATMSDVTLLNARERERVSAR
jgi:hypothetical protein